MANAADILWFKTQYSAAITQAVQGTPFDVDMLTAVACQETGSLWGVMRKDASLTPAQIAALCCGDTLDANKGRSAFPKTKADLVAVPNGQAMFTIARQALLNMAAEVPGYGFAFTNQAKFCHGYGIFQYDLQFFLTNPDYFLQRRYEDFGNSLARALGELKNGLRKRGLQNATTITDADFCTVAICYNTGGYKPAKGLKQGHFDGTRFYGEAIRDFLKMARSVAVAGVAPVVTPPPLGTTSVPPSPAAAATGPSFRVETSTTTLRLRSEARKSVPPEANVVANLPDGHIVRSFTGTPDSGFIEVEATLGGKLFRGFASAGFLVQITQPAAAAAIAAAAPAPAAATLPEARLTHAPGSVTKRSANATAHSLNEANMPLRSAADPAGLRADLGAIIDYLAPDRQAHKRYWPRDGLTFCNIYVHDYCTLAGTYLPRVWWTQPALLKLAAGQTVVAKIGNTVDEVRANDIFRWLRDFGPNFGWSRATSVTALQDHANLGGVSLIVARRKEDGRSGHIVAVVPETATEEARRDATGAVTMPLQSQAGTVNFRYGLSSPNWWKDARFAEAAFWLHG